VFAELITALKAMDLEFNRKQQQGLAAGALGMTEFRAVFCMTGHDEIFRRLRESLQNGYFGQLPCNADKHSVPRRFTQFST